MKITAFLFALTALLFQNTFAEQQNFSCSIFANVQGGQVQGSLVLTGSDPFAPNYELKISEGGGPERTFTGAVRLTGKSSFTNLDMDVQKAIMNAIAHSGNGNAKTGEFILFANTKNLADATFSVALMPSAQLAYLQVGVLQLLCM